MVIRMRHTRAHTKNRRSHHKAPETSLVVDKETKVAHMRHRVCLETGMYKGKQVLSVAKNKKEKASK
ncbi:MAG: 50S ribosomal protein L32 [Candidatus Paceibacterota bacterium]